MSVSQFEPWSNNPNAPNIWYSVYLWEKINFAGYLVGSILYGMPRISLPTCPTTRAHYSLWLIPGMLTVLFFNCISALFSPIYRRDEGIKWGVVSFTVIVFSLATIQTAINLNFLSISYIDNREYPGVEGEYVPGPAGYQSSVSLEPINIFPYAAIPLNSWLADGLLVSSLLRAAFNSPGV